MNFGIQDRYGYDNYEILQQMGEQQKILSQMKQQYVKHQKDLQIKEQIAKYFQFINKKDVIQQLNESIKSQIE